MSKNETSGVESGNAVNDINKQKETQEQEQKKKKKNQNKSIT